MKHLCCFKQSEKIFKSYFVSFPQLLLLLLIDLGTLTCLKIAVVTQIKQCNCMCLLIIGLLKESYLFLQLNKLVIASQFALKNPK